MPRHSVGKITSYSPFGTLTDDDFTIRSTSYTVQSIGYGFDGGNESLGILISEPFAAQRDKASLTVHVGSSHLHLSSPLSNRHMLEIADITVGAYFPLPGRSALRSV